MWEVFTEPKLNIICKLLFLTTIYLNFRDTTWIADKNFLSQFPG